MPTIFEGGEGDLLLLEPPLSILLYELSLLPIFESSFDKLIDLRDVLELILRLIFNDFDS